MTNQPLNDCEQELPSASTPMSIGFWFGHVGRAYRNRLQARLHELGMHIGQEIVIMTLVNEDGQTQSQLAETLRVEPPTVTKMIGRMERNGWVERRPDSEDGRITRVYVTERARSLSREIERVWAELESEMLVGVSDIEQALLRRVLDTMHANLKR